MHGLRPYAGIALPLHISLAAPYHTRCIYAERKHLFSWYCCSAAPTALLDASIIIAKLAPGTGWNNIVASANARFRSENAGSVTLDQTTISSPFLFGPRGKSIFNGSWIFATLGMNLL